MDNIFSRLEMEHPSEREKIVISRYWNNPAIKVAVNQEKIEIFTDIDNFIECLYQELDKSDIKLTLKERVFGRISPNKPDIQKQLFDAKNRIIEKIKESTSQVM